MVIIQVDTVMKPEQYIEIVRSMQKQYLTGCIVLPAYCSLAFAGDDTVVIKGEVNDENLC